jgi:hypothetical protein
MRSWRRVPASRALGLDLGTRRPGRLGGLLLAARTEATDCTLIFSERPPGSGWMYMEAAWIVRFSAWSS